MGPEQRIRGDVGIGDLLTLGRAVLSLVLQDQAKHISARRLTHRLGKTDREPLVAADRHPWGCLAGFRAGFFLARIATCG
jgi:hypothetical protein